MVMGYLLLQLFRDVLIVVERLVRVGEEMVEGEGMNCRHLPVPER
jgi:hypothetical protein